MDINWKSPWVLGGGGLLLIVLIMAGKGGASSTSGADGVASQSVATSANVQLAQLSIGLQAEQDQTGAAETIALAQNQGSIFGMALSYLTNIDNNNVTRGNTAAAVSVNTDNNTTLLKLTSANNGTFEKIAPELATISASNAQALASIQAGEAETIATTNANAMLEGNRIQGQTQQTQSTNSLLGGLGGIAGSLLAAFL